MQGISTVAYLAGKVRRYQRWTFLLAGPQINRLTLIQTLWPGVIRNFF